MKVISHGYMYDDSTGGLLAFLLVICVILFILSLGIFEKLWVSLLFVAISIFLMVMKPILGTPYYKAIFDNTYSPKGNLRAIRGASSRIPVLLHKGWRQEIEGKNMGKAYRKPRPSVPHWFFSDNDNCWCCKDRNNCNQCRLCKENAVKEKERRDRDEKRRLMKEGENYE